MNRNFQVQNLFLCVPSNVETFSWDTRYKLCYGAKYSIGYFKIIIEPSNCYVILPRTLSLMVKLLLGSQGMLPLPVPAKVVVVVSGKNCVEIQFSGTRNTEEKN